MATSLSEGIKSVFVKSRNSIKASIRLSKRDSIIHKWEKAGKPLPPPHQVKQKTIEFYKVQSGYTILVETGTFLGEMVDAQRNNFEHIYSIELSEKLWRKAVERFKFYKNITIIQGDSGKKLGEIVKQLKTPAIFWLDGHYSAGETAKGDKECPIFEEIDAIFSNKKQGHILLIDDARCFVGEGDYPTIEELTQYIQNKEQSYEVEVKDDVIRYMINGNYAKTS